MNDAPPARADVPVFGLVCVTASDAVRFKTVTRTNYLKLDEAARYEKLDFLYRENTRRLLGALEFCNARGIRLYRMTSQLFPMSDLEDGIGARVLAELAPELPEVGRRAAAYGIRVVVHPDQFVVLSSDSETVYENSVLILAQHARNLDLMELPRSPWSMLLLHGGKGGRGEVLARRIATLPPEIRSRLALENDEHAYGAQAILDVCRAASVPMVFDAHHHVIKEKLLNYEDESVERFTRAARDTWPNPDDQLVHLSNGKEGILDRRHSDLIDTFPTAFLKVKWVEIEAKGKEDAIADLQARFADPHAPILTVRRVPPPEAAYPDKEEV
ncbi:UV DNA damage repair endonuclease UvsE [Deinococcus yavapaiensis]|uniref:UV-damage endonuclease n=1 Tax=Deinococcus yavapaiensis KR-236 TaxID=694435 RepID=A0A318SKX1_9DEIO|nr:UV DNA damage repair endonuclease UvsE [Deinococcus yavapaiensis]PYE55019.1 UV-damage endonuclease [Deinococcus yavapaiensis KR-236]